MSEIMARKGKTVQGSYSAPTPLPLDKLKSTPFMPSRGLLHYLCSVSSNNLTFLLFGRDNGNS